MPCDTVNTITIDFGKADAGLLKSAMAKLYPGWEYNLVGNKLTTYGQVDESSIKREMSRQSVTAQAKRFGWSVKEQPDGKLLVQKARL